MTHSILYKFFVVSSAAVALSGCVSTPVTHEWQPDTTYHLTVLQTNDHHGHFWASNDGEYGMAARKTIIDRIRKEVTAQGGNVLLFSGGDINTGVPESDLQDAEPDFKGMNLLGYDAMALGNHEFDNPPAVLMKEKQWAHFPFLSANIYDRATGKRKFQPYTLFNKHGINIAVIGLTTEDTAKIGNPEYVSELEFRDPKIEAKALIAELKSTVHPDLIFAITHMGYYPNADHGSNAPGDVSLARALNPGDLDVIIGAHSHDAVCMLSANVVNTHYRPGEACQPDKQNGTIITQANEWGKYVGRADYDFRNGKLTLVHYQLIPVNLKKRVTENGESKKIFAETYVQPDPHAIRFFTPFEEKGQKALSVDIARVSEKLEGDRHVVRFRQTNLGRLIATAQMEKVHADFGIINSGGVRDSIAPGVVTYKDVLKVQPFGNQVSYIEMKGKDIQSYLDVVASKTVDSGAYAQFAGIAMTVKNGQVRDVRIQGKPLDDTRTYRFSVPSFNAAGGDGYPNITQLPGYVDSGYVDADVLKAYLQTHSPVDVSLYAPHGEIQYQ